MRVFLSWSGELSRSVAKILQEWLPSVVQSVEPFVSSESIEKGSRWGTQLEDALESSSFGIICLTRENLQSPWVSFEAGALSRGLALGHVCPLLVDVGPEEIRGPLADFQSSRFNKSEIAQLVGAINNASGAQAIDSARLARLFEVIWPELEVNINAALIAHASKRDSSEKEVPSSRTFTLLASRGTLINPSDQSRNISFKVETINLILRSLGANLTSAAGIDESKAAFSNAGKAAAKVFGEKIVEKWGLEYPDDNISQIVDRWCSFDSDVGWGRLVNELIVDEHTGDLSGAIRLIDNFQTYKPSGTSTADCSLMEGYIEGVLESICAGAPVTLTCELEHTPQTHRLKKDCVFRISAPRMAAS